MPLQGNITKPIRNKNNDLKNLQDTPEWSKAASHSRTDSLSPESKLRPKAKSTKPSHRITKSKSDTQARFRHLAGKSLKLSTTTKALNDAVRAQRASLDAETSSRYKEQSLKVALSMYKLVQDQGMAHLYLKSGALVAKLEAMGDTVQE